MTEPENIQNHDAPGASFFMERRITAEQLSVEMLRRRYASLLEREEVYPSDENWQYIIDHRLCRGLVNKLYRKYLVSSLMPGNQLTGWHKIALRRFPEYITSIDRNAALDAVYADTASSPKVTSDLIHKCRLFSAPHLLGILSDTRSYGNDVPQDARRESLACLDFVVSALDAMQPDYGQFDVKNMRSLLEALQNLPPLGEVVEGQGIFSRSRKYVCPCGHSNSADDEFCRTAGCGRDIYGLTEGQREAIAAFRERIGVIAELLRPE